MRALGCSRFSLQPLSAASMLVFLDKESHCSVRQLKNRILKAKERPLKRSGKRPSLSGPGPATPPIRAPCLRCRGRNGRFQSHLPDRTCRLWRFCKPAAPSPSASSRNALLQSHGMYLICHNSSAEPVGRTYPGLDSPFMSSGPCQPQW